MITDPRDLSDWVPTRVYRRDEGVFADWSYLGSRRFTHPFFEDTIQQSFRLPFSLLFRRETPIDFLGRVFDEAPGLKPAGFIFHMSRCGSTLIAQMLAAVEKNIVISEAPPIDSVLNAGNAIGSDEQRRLWLKWTISALGRKRTPTEERYFIKFDCWTTLEIDFVRNVFPEVPATFVFRDPVEVIVSHMRRRGSQMIPGQINRILPGLELEEAAQIPPEEYCAKVLARICDAALKDAAHHSLLLVNYDQLPGAVVTTIAKHFGIEFDPDEIELMNTAATFDAKSPARRFTPDSEQKRNDASNVARDAARTIVGPLYERLEDLRVKALTAI